MCIYQDFSAGLLRRQPMVNGTGHPFADVQLVHLPCGMNGLDVRHYHRVETSLLSHNLHIAKVL